MTEYWRKIYKLENTLDIVLLILFFVIIGSAGNIHRMAILKWSLGISCAVFLLVDFYRTYLDVKIEALSIKKIS